MGMKFHCIFLRTDYYIKLKRFSLQFVSLLEMRPLKSVVELPPPVMAPPPPESVVEVPPELPMLVAEFCLTAAFEIAIRSNQTPTQYYSITFHLVCLVMVFAFAFIFVAKYISSKHPNPGRVLEHAGVVCGVTAFFVAITVSFPLCLKGLEISKEAWNGITDTSLVDNI
ncbi:uncharacterized protein LOC114301604 [Camellia sinensis]|uniref:uncharacterized protein LOC114301604 n=1 Tax=Camellia sinensis TaxID=4442 RepID=UPI001035B6C8|nr:uncharacterized protein LOC114301604 [Camellia sinensis]XP_028102361.1 uncharacterized protein LOC114301604 [Camellia sinensis]XP_028102362.1 uncharacterized protein LOC114301604 [Camellia sinensis]XP_028102363.1 uncharacterized protein LOC114301604 [Camellia sinensis]XP_028102364.1 uncharacterized protein LOC114301604 [Camellia sinensis]XP_028102365.1 uncharacterized protein LOC114301604 [Camellia sinensis]